MPYFKDKMNEANVSGLSLCVYANVFLLQARVKALLGKLK